MRANTGNVHGSGIIDADGDSWHAQRFSVDTSFVYAVVERQSAHKHSSYRGAHVGHNDIFHGAHIAIHPVL